MRRAVIAYAAELGLLASTSPTASDSPRISVAPLVMAMSSPSCPARSGISITVSPILQQNATPEDIEAHIDIADWLIRYKLGGGCHSERSPQGGVEESQRRHRIDFLKAARYISPEYHEELEALIEDLDLEFWGVERIEKTEEEKPP